jgi:hypothetical protein
MTGWMQYYASRAAVTAVVVALLLLSGSTWWIVVTVGVAVFGFFVFASRSGRYVVRAERGVTPFRRDERARAIAHLAARNAFIVLMVALAGVCIVYGFVLNRGLPVLALYLLLALGWVSYFVSDVWLRRR